MPLAERLEVALEPAHQLERRPAELVRRDARPKILLGFREDAGDRLRQPGRDHPGLRESLRPVGEPGLGKVVTAEDEIRDRGQADGRKGRQLRDEPGRLDEALP